MITVSINSNSEYKQFVEFLKTNLNLKLDYQFMEENNQTVFPLWRMGTSLRSMWKNQDEIGYVYHCMLYTHIDLLPIVKGLFEIQYNYQVVYGIQHEHPDTIHNDLETLEDFTEEQRIKIREFVHLYSLSLNKAVDKSIQSLEEWREKIVNTEEYLLKE